MTVARTRTPCLLLLLLLPWTTSAHIVPVPPSTCAFDPVTIEAPSSGVVGTAAPAGSADQFRILYDPAASQADFDMESLPPRGFTAAGVEGTVALPGVGIATLLSFCPTGTCTAGTRSGDLTMVSSLTVTLNGSSTTVPITLTTGLTAAGAGMVVEGVPMGRDGRFTLVGLVAGSALGPPLDGPLVTVQLTCQAVPAPDTDQFHFATQTTPVSATLTARAFNLRAIFAPGPTETPNFPASPALLRASSGGTTLTTVDLPSGLPARGRSLFIGRSADRRAALGVRRLQRPGPPAYLLAVKIKNPTLPAAASGPVSVALTYDVGGLLSHLGLPMRVKRHATLLHYP